MNTAQIDTGYEELCTRGEEAARQNDRNRYLIGQLALLVETYYNENTLSAYGKRINVRVSTLYEYRNVARWRENSAARKFCDEEMYPTLCYTHFRNAARMDTLDDGIAHLEKCASLSLTIEESEVLIAKETGKPIKVAEFEYRFGYNAPYYIPISEELYYQTKPEKNYRIVIYEVEESKANGL